MLEITKEKACELIYKILINAEDAVDDVMIKAQKGEITLKNLNKALDKIVEDNMKKELKNIRNEELN